MPQYERRKENSQMIMVRRLIDEDSRFLSQSVSFKKADFDSLNDLRRIAGTGGNVVNPYDGKNYKAVERKAIQFKLDNHIIIK